MTEEYKEKLEAGQEYQDWVCDVLLKQCGIFVGQYSSKKYQQEKGESQAGYEIKHDRLMNSTRNVFVEIAEKSNKDNKNFIPSGIYRNDNSWIYVIGDYHEILLFSKHQLRKLIENETLRERHKMQYKEIKAGTSIGYTYPIEMALKSGSCLKYIIVEEGEQ